MTTADALNRSTQTLRAYPGGRSRVTTTHPDLSTTINDSFGDGRTKSTSGTAVYTRRMEYGVAVTAGGTGPQRFTTTYVVDGTGADTGEWTRSWTDAVGRTWKQESSSGAGQISQYNSKGQMISSADADGVTTLYQYDNRGRRTHTAIDINQNGTIDFGGPDRISAVDYGVAERDGQVVNRNTSRMWRDSGEQVLTISETSADGLQSWSTLVGVPLATSKPSWQVEETGS